MMVRLRYFSACNQCVAVCVCMHNILHSRCAMYCQAMQAAQAHRQGGGGGGGGSRGFA